MADHVSSNSFAVVEQHDTEETLVVVTDDGEVELTGEHRDLHLLVVDMERQLNRAVQQ